MSEYDETDWQNATTNYLKEQRHAIEDQPWKTVENATFDLIEKVLNKRYVSDAWIILRAEDGTTPVAIVHKDFLPDTDDFLPAFIEARRQSVPKFKDTAELFAQAQISDYKEVFLPIVCFNVNSETLDSDFEKEDFSKVLNKGLEEIPHWKASSTLIFSDSINPQHDFPKYALERATQIGISLNEFLLIQTAHENNHILVDALMKSFNEANTWLHEGACEFLTDNSARVHFLFEEFFRENEKMSPVDILENKSRHHIYGGGWALIKAISSKYNSEDPKTGLADFLVDLHDLKQKDQTGAGDITISTATLILLENMNIKGDIFQEINELS